MASAPKGAKEAASSSSSSSSPSPSPAEPLPVQFLTAALRSSALLSSVNGAISPASLNALLSSAYPVTFPPNTVLIQQGQLSSPQRAAAASSSRPPLYIIHSGDVHVTVSKHSQPAVTVGKVHPSDLVGDQSLLSDHPPSASVVTASEVTAYALPREEVEAFIARHEEVRENVRQRRWLWSAVSKVPQFSGLDDDVRKEGLIAQFQREEVKGGDVVVRYGDVGDRFYVIERGDCEVRVPFSFNTAPSTSSTPEPLPAPSAASSSPPPSHPDVVVATKGPSDSFGEIALLYSVPRRATVTCASRDGCSLWSVDAETFRSACREGSLWLKSVFYEYASVRDANTGEGLMTDKDFFEAVKRTTLRRDKKRLLGKRKAGGEEAAAAEEEKKEAEGGSALRMAKNALSEQQLRLMFRLADQSGDNLISFSEFVLLNSLLTSPLSKYAVAFRVFDRDKSGSVDREEFIQVVKSLTEDKGGKHDWQHDSFINELFGPPADEGGGGGGGGSGAAAAGGRKRGLTYAQFEDLLSRDVLPAWLHTVKHDLRSVDDYWMRWNQSMAGDNSVGMTIATDASTAFAFPSWKSLVAGGVAGAVSRTVVSPLERVKLLFQMQGQPPRYTGVLQAMRVIYREDGLYGYFRGNLANVIRITPTSAFQFFFYDLYKKLFFSSRTELQPIERLWAGGLAGCTACVLTYPLDLIRARLTFQSGSFKQYNGITHGLLTVVRTEGPLALYRGLWPSIAGIFPYIGIDFMVYETLKQWLPHNPYFRSSHGDPRKHALLGCGAIAGVVGQTLAYPLDLVRRRMQVMGWAQQTSYHYKHGIARTMMQIVQEEGVRGLYRGMVPNYFKASKQQQQQPPPAAAASLLARTAADRCFCLCSDALLLRWFRQSASALSPTRR